MTNSIYGEKGGKSGGGSARVAKEAPNTLQSNSVARILDVIGEGEIVGLVDGHKSIIIDETPLQNEDDSYNFDGVLVTTRVGTPDQSFISGFPAVETIRDISTQVVQAAPIVRTISTLTVNAARVTISLPRLTEQNKENGDLNGSSVTIAFDAMPAGGSWQEVIYDTISGKTTSTYQRSYRFELPGTGPWDIRMRRISADEDDDEAIQNDTYWATLTELTDAKLTYPDTALVALEVNAKDFGDTIPSRSYDVKGKIINVPDNYDPETREYTGLWSGNFKLAWTDNPAWVYYDLATNERYGAGIDNVDKWSLYQIGQYCDALVDNGYGEQEPRYTFNSALSSEEEAFDALNSLASVFRGMTFWGSDTVVATADMPADVQKLVTPSNVIDGEFEYQGTSLKDRHSIALVTWNDPDSNYEKTIEVVEDSAAIQKYGFRKTDITAVGCTSRGQARRLGLWALYSERSETETVTYRASADQADLRPGDLIGVSDPSIAGARLGGRVRVPGLTVLELDQRPEEAFGQDWFLDVVMPNGGIERREVTDFDGNSVSLSFPLNDTPVAGAQWILSSADVEPRQFRVIGISEEEEGIYSITALEHNPNKYAEVEQGLVLPEPDYSLLPTGPVSAPYNISTETSTYIAGGTQHQKLTISWTGSDDPRVTSYICEVDGPDDVAWIGAYSGEGLSVDLLDITPGEWNIRVRGVTSLGQRSPWVVITTNIVGLLEPVAPDSVGVEVGTFQVKLSPTGGKPGQLWQYWRSNVALADESLIETNAVLLASSNGFYTDTGLDPLTTYYYYVRGSNQYGVSDWYPVQATTEGDASAILSALTDKITEGQLYQELNDRINLVDGAATIEGSVNQRVQEEADARIAAISAEAQARIDGLAQEASERASDITSVENAYTTADSALSERIDTLSAAGDGYAAQIQAEQTARIDGDEALASDITALTATVNQNGADIQSEQTARVNADEALASDVTTLYATTGSNTSLIQAEQTARADGDSALSTRIDTLSSTADGNSSDIIVERQARIDGDDALASDITQLRADVDDNAALIQSEQTARADGDNALASDLTVLTTRVGDNEAGLASEATARADGDSALSSQITTLSASVDSTTAEIQTKLNASVTGASLVADGSFSSGDGSLWSNTFPATISSRDTSSGPLYSGSPSAYFAIFDAANYGSDRFVVGNLEDVTPNDEYEVGMWVSKNGSADGHIRLGVQWFDADMLQIGWPNAYRLDLSSIVNGEWFETPSVTLTVPTTASFGRVVVTVESDSTQGQAAFTSVKARISDKAMSERIDTVQASLGSDIASVEQSLTTEIDALDGTVSALYTLRTDVNGRVSGFGLSNDGAESEFGILADRFYIADPDSGANEAIPFIFDKGTLYLREALIGELTFNKLTDDTGTFIVQNGKIQAEYLSVTGLEVEWADIQNVDIVTADIQDAAITSAKIDDLAVTSAKIGDAAVDTLQIAGDAVTVPVSSYTGGSVALGEESWSTVQSVTINPLGAPVSVSGCIVLDISSVDIPGQGGDSARAAVSARLRVLRDGSVIRDYGEVAFNEQKTNQVTASADIKSIISFSFLDTSGGTSRTYVAQIYANTEAGSSSSRDSRSRFLQALGVKR